MSGEDTVMDTVMDSVMDNCSRWNKEHEQLFLNSGIPENLQIEWLETCIGSQRMDSGILWSLTVAYLTMAVTGIVGNILVCAVIFRNISMRTSTNFYLFNLAVADIIIILMGVTFDLSIYWHQYPWLLGETVCKLRAWIAEMTFYSSVLTIFCFSCERYLAICHPLYLYTMAGTGKTTRLIIVLWILSGAAAIPFAVFSKVNYTKDPYLPDKDVTLSAFCGMLDAPLYLYEFSSVIFFLVPMLSLVFMYSMMGWKLVTASRRRQSLMTMERGRENNTKTKKTVLKMLAIVVFCFFVCWAPLHTQRLMFVAYNTYGFDWISEEVYFVANEQLMYVTGIFLYLNSTINPIIYNLISSKYRKAFKETSCGKRTIQKNEEDYTHITKDTIKTVRSQSQSVRSEDILKV